MHNQVKYYKDITNNRFIKLDCEKYLFYYLSSNFEWVKDNSICRDMLGTGNKVEFKELSEFEDTYPYKKKEIKYRYFRTRLGLIMKIDEDNDMCYTLGNDNLWHMDLSIYQEYLHGEIIGEFIEMDDNFQYGDKFLYGYSSKWRK